MNPTTFLRAASACVALLIAGVSSGQESKYDEPPMPSKTFPAAYPSSLRSEGINGMVTISILVDEKGNVQEAVVKKSTRPEFEQPAIEAIKKWKFEPAKKDGKPIAMSVLIPLKFTAK